MKKTTVRGLIVLVAAGSGAGVAGAAPDRIDAVWPLRSASGWGVEVSTVPDVEAPIAEVSAESDTLGTGSCVPLAPRELHVAGLQLGLADGQGELVGTDAKGIVRYGAGVWSDASGHFDLWDGAAKVSGGGGVIFAHELAPVGDEALLSAVGFVPGPGAAEAAQGETLAWSLAWQTAEGAEVVSLSPVATRVPWRCTFPSDAGGVAHRVRVRAFVEKTKVTKKGVEKTRTVVADREVGRIADPGVDGDEGTPSAVVAGDPLTQVLVLEDRRFAPGSDGGWSLVVASDGWTRDMAPAGAELEVNGSQSTLETRS